MTQLTLTSPWQYTDDWRRAFAETNDPRVLAVIELDEGNEGPDGDAYAPAYFLEYRYSWTGSMAGTTYDDQDALSAYLRARDAVPFNSKGSPRFDSHEFAARFMRIFHDTNAYEFVNRDYRMVTLDTPAWRAHVGIEPGLASLAEADLTHDHYAWLHSEVYGVGYAVREGRVFKDDESIDLADWDVTIECWGFYGQDYAKQEAGTFEYGEPELHPLLELTS